jgi:hypothetical protein
MQPKKTNFGPVATINTAPVAIGNSIRGAKQRVVSNALGVTVSGRDFMFAPIGTGSVTTWTLCGGTPLTPAAFSDSTLRQYMQMYQKFKWISLVVHYITSSPTSSSGDVMFYHQKNRNSVFLNQTSTQLLPFVMSDEDTVLGPQWTNHSARLHMTTRPLSTDYGMTANSDDYADGEIFLLSKTGTTDSPGYVIFDYVVSFTELQISPRLLSLPLPRAQWSQTNFVLTSQSYSAGTQIALTVGGNNLSGSAAVVPSGAANGDIYKIILDITNSSSASWTNITAATGFRVTEAGGSVVVPFVDGTTFYAIYNGTDFRPFATAEASYASGSQVASNVTATVTYNLQCWLSLIGTVSATNLNPNF